MRRKRPKSFNTSAGDHARLRRRWRRWLPVLESDISHLLGKKEIFWDLQKVAKENRDVLSAFFEWMCSNYIIAAAIEIRALADRRNDVHSLWRMLYEILEHPGVINRRGHSALYPDSPPAREFNMADHTFDLVAGKRSLVLRQRDIRADLRELEDVSERVYTFVNKRLAHRAPKGELRRLPRFNEVDHAMATIDRIFCKYNLLLTAKGMSSTFATRQDNWMAVLYDPWIKPGSKFRPA